MSDENTQTAPEAEKPKKQAVSKREILDRAGQVQDDWIGAGGFKYTSLAEDFALAVLFEELPEESVFGLAAFGGLTLAGNVTNTIRNGERKGDGPSTEKDALIAWIENLKSGNWTSPKGEVEAGVGMLAEAYVKAMAKEGKVLELATVQAKLKEADKEAKKKIRSHPAVKLAMLELQAERAAKKAASAETPIGDLL